MTVNRSSRAVSIFPNADEHCNDFSNYSPIICSFGKVLVQVDAGAYSGDTLVLLSKNGLYGFLAFGWGSCSGCDALQACQTFADVDELIDSLESSIQWFDTLQQAQAYIANSNERLGSYYSHLDEWPDFQAMVAELEAT